MMSGGWIGPFFKRADSLRGSPPRATCRRFVHLRGPATQQARAPKERSWCALSCRSDSSSANLWRGARSDSSLDQKQSAATISGYGDGTLLSQRVREVADRIGLTSFTLDAARHGGMTELEEAGLTEGEGRSLSKHRTSGAYRGYAKETELRVLNATKKRFGHSERPEKPNEINVLKMGKSA